MLARPQAELAVPGECEPNTVSVLGESVHGTDAEGQEGLWAQLGRTAL